MSPLGQQRPVNNSFIVACGWQLPAKRGRTGRKSYATFHDFNQLIDTANDLNSPISRALGTSAAMPYSPSSSTSLK